MATWSPPRPNARSSELFASSPNSGKKSVPIPTPILKVIGASKSSFRFLIVSKIWNFSFSIFFKSFTFNNPINLSSSILFRYILFFLAQSVKVTTIVASNLLATSSSSES